MTGTDRKISLYTRRHTYECANIDICSYLNLQRNWWLRRDPVAASGKLQPSKMHRMNTVLCLQWNDLALSYESAS